MRYKEWHDEDWKRVLGVVAAHWPTLTNQWKAANENSLILECDKPYKLWHDSLSRFPVEWVCETLKDIATRSDRFLKLNNVMAALYQMQRERHAENRIDTMTCKQIEEAERAELAEQWAQCRAVYDTIPDESRTLHLQSVVKENPNFAWMVGRPLDSRGVMALVVARHRDGVAPDEIRQTRKEAFAW